jgi:hypothetical protein
MVSGTRYLMDVGSQRRRENGHMQWDLFKKRLGDPAYWSYFRRDGSCFPSKTGMGMPIS